jgi:hypothetical protein
VLCLKRRERRERKIGRRELFSPFRENVRRGKIRKREKEGKVRVLVMFFYLFCVVLLYVVRASGLIASFVLGWNVVWCTVM